MSLSDVINAALEKMNYVAKTETVVGEPIIAGEVTLIPVSKLSIGFAAGGGGNENKIGTGVGTGGGVTVEPIAFIAVTRDRVQVHPVAGEESDLSRILSMAPGAIRKISEFVKKRKDDDAPDAGADSGE